MGGELCGLRALSVTSRYRKKRMAPTKVFLRVNETSVTCHHVFDTTIGVFGRSPRSEGTLRVTRSQGGGASGCDGSGSGILPSCGPGTAQINPVLTPHLLQESKGDHVPVHLLTAQALGPVHPQLNVRISHLTHSAHWPSRPVTAQGQILAFAFSKTRSTVCPVLLPREGQRLCWAICSPGAGEGGTRTFTYFL